MRRPRLIGYWGLAGLLACAATGLGDPVAPAEESPAPTVAQPTPFLNVDLPGRSLTAEVGTPVELQLRLPTDAAWGTDFGQANLGRLVLRTYGKNQSLLPGGARAGTTSVACRFDEPGYVMLILAAGPAEFKGLSDSWQRTNYCSKVVLRVNPKSGEPSPEQLARDPGTGGKLGSKIEVLPYFSPVALTVGADLPVRVYFEGSSQRGAAVTAYRPDGSTETQTSNNTGIANFRINQAGRWIIRYSKTVAESHGDETYIAELVFEVPAPAQPESSQPEAEKPAAAKGGAA